jgi:hypothetical protein
VALGAKGGDATEPGGAGAEPAGRRVKVEELGVGPSVRLLSSPPPDRPVSPRESSDVDMPEAIRLAPMETPADPVLDEVAAALVRLGEAAWGDMRVAMADVARAYGSGYPSVEGYGAQREEVSAAMEGAQKRAWAHRARLKEVAAYLRGETAVPAWWYEHGREAGGREIEGKGKGRETGGNKKRKVM